MRIIAQLNRQQKRKLRRLIYKERDAGMKTRMSIILHVARSTVYRVARRYRDGELARHGRSS